MSVTKFAVAIATISMVASSALASTNLVGTWKGKIKINMAKLPPATSPQMKTMMDQQIAAVGKTTLVLTLVKGGSYTMKVEGSSLPGATKDSTKKGTWTLKGNLLTLTGDGKKDTPHPFTVSKDGKSFSVDIQNGIAQMKFTK